MNFTNGYIDIHTHILPGVDDGALNTEQGLAMVKMAYENGTRPIPWSVYLALLFYFDYIPSTHYMIRQLDLFPNEFDECWLAGKVLVEGEL